MYLIITLVVILTILLYVCFKDSILKTEKFQVLISPNQNLTKFAKLHNIEYSANIPGIESHDIYDVPNKCLKYASMENCSSNTFVPSNDLDCNQSIQPNMNGLCKCTKKNVYLDCNPNRKLTNCNEICEEEVPPKSLEFNGKDSKIEMDISYAHNNGFTLSFYIKLSEFKRFPYKSQMILLAKNQQGKDSFIIYVNENRKVCVYSFETKMNYIDPNELSTNWFSISLGNLLTNQFIQVNDKRKLFTSMNIDTPNETNTTLTLQFGSAIELENTYNPFKGILGNITLYEKYLDEVEVCQNNKYCGELNLELENMEKKCVFSARGNKVTECIKNCNNDSINNNCSIEQCIEKCDTCTDKTECKWKKPDFTLSVNQPKQEVVEDPEKCMFKPWGVNESHCVDECFNGENRDHYGGDKCSQKNCASICKQCTDIKFCPWLVPGQTGDSNAKPPNPPHNLVGLPASRTILLMWSKPNSNNSDIIGYKILYYKANNPQEGIKMRNITEQEIKTSLKYNITGLINDVTYNVGVVAVNAKGSSQLSKVIAVKPYNTNMSVVTEGFRNPNRRSNASNSDSENDKKDEGCNLFNSLRGKQINISF